MNKIDRYEVKRQLIEKKGRLLACLDFILGRNIKIIPQEVLEKEKQEAKKRAMKYIDDLVEYLETLSKYDETKEMLNTWELSCLFQSLKEVQSAYRKKRDLDVKHVKKLLYEVIW